MVSVTFDQVLAPPLLDLTNWVIRYLLRDASPVAAPVVLGTLVTWTAGPPGALKAPPDRITYYADPPDLVGALTGLPVATFTIPFDVV